MEKLYIGNQADCQALREILDYALDMPFPGSINGVPVVDNATKLVMQDAWRAKTLGERDAIIANPVAPWQHWTLQWATLNAEPSPGTRFAVWIPADMATTISDSIAAGRMLTLEQVAALTAAAASAVGGFPGDWVGIGD